MLNMLRRMLLALLDENYSANKVELARLRGNSAAVPQRNCWYRLVQGGITTSFEHVCKCAHSVKIVSPLDMFKTYRCNCGESFSLFKDARIPRAAAPEKFGEYLMKLPARVGAGTQERNKTPKVGAWDVDGETVQWVGAPQ